MKECPMCGRPIAARAKRTCASCGKPIRKHDKWHIDGSVVRHDNCANPEMKPPAEGPLLTEMSAREESQHENGSREEGKQEDDAASVTDPAGEDARD